MQYLLRTEKKTKIFRRTNYKDTKEKLGPIRQIVH
jgi:hypothetical protein